MSSQTHYEVLQVGKEWCLRIRATGRPVAWSKTNDSAFQAYCREAEANTAYYLED